MRQPNSGPSLSPASQLALERRRGHRCDVTRRFVSVDFGDDNGGLLLNLSATGAAVQAVARLRRGAHIPFSFSLPGDESHRVEGRAVTQWVGGSGLVGGIRFERLSPASRAELERWLERPSARISPASVFVLAAKLPALAKSATTAGVAAAAPGALGDLAHHALILTGAEGAAIALRKAQGRFVCLYSEGMAPAVGCQVSADSGLSGACVASARAVMCEDAERDPRVNPAARGSLASAALVPVLDHAGAVIGLVAVFSRRAKAFTAAHLDDLLSLAAALGVLAQADGETPASAAPSR